MIEKITLTGKIVEKSNKLPLEYATISLKKNNTSEMIFGGVTNEKGLFTVDIAPDIYDIIVEFMSFKPLILKKKSLLKNYDLGTLFMEEDFTQLKEVVIQNERSAVEIKLDKKVYNVGQDMTVKGGSASDVLDNVPSVSVDAEGKVSLRGNENVKILIDGRPSTSINIETALKNIPSDALDKIEVITNPSSRYDAEGGGGIINIIQKKGKNNGINGSVIFTVGNPKNYSLSSNVNFKNKYFNIYSTIGIKDSKSKGMSFTNSKYLDENREISKKIVEDSQRERNNKGYNYTIGTDLYFSKSITWTNIINYNKYKGLEPSDVTSYNFESIDYFVRNRYNDQTSNSGEVNYSTNLTINFAKEGHKLTIDASTSKDKDENYSIITDKIIGQEELATFEKTKNFEYNNHKLLQSDYVLPLGKNGKFEAGYKGDFSERTNDYRVGNIINGIYTSNENYTNFFEYNEAINALYSQIGTKFNKTSVLFGIRYEDSDINSNLITTSQFFHKKYYNYFPSAFFTYELKENSSLSFNYSKRISRPRGHFINPFSSYSSNINIFQGNPDLNPSLTDSYDLGYITKINSFTISTSLYYNFTKDVFQFIRRPNGDYITSEVDGETIVTPVTLITPINLATEDRFGYELTLNYSPLKWWKLNGNINLYKSSIKGIYTYKLLDGEELVNENLGNDSNAWTAKLGSKIKLPFQIDWQTNVNYRSPRNNAQGKSLGTTYVNLSLNKEFLKDKGVVALSINDLFNSNKRISEIHLNNLDSYSEFQWRKRQINLSFTYRFNKQKTEKESKSKPFQENNFDGGDF